ncbi:MAG: mannose-1-phosphate guanylyltransferase [Candidatus Omnitrophica bacterium]|nr:Mannose-1-phosphate guanylyltransferase RfbM [bacterium]NUN94709.1 mannose-1-phosphate guanylyltransferase [Candidatus Omnitrophota bacterium]
MSAVIAVLMAGGLGTRLWPWSRVDRPKQFLPLLGERSLARETWDRILPLAAPERILALTNRHLLEVARNELPDLREENLFGEPKSCNTAPCVALAAAISERRWGPDSVMAVLSADHYLGDVEAFRSSLLAAIRVARAEHCLVTLGIVPTRPESGYGYLECERNVAEILDGDSARLVAFREKPSLELAAEYLRSGRHLWNMGNFIWRVDSILAEFERQMPALLESARCAADSGSIMPEALDRFYLGLPPELCLSIDYGIMENARDVRVVPCRAPWDDVGSWAVLRRLRGGELDEQGNLSTIRHLAIDTRNTLVTGSDSPDGIVATLGVEGLVIVRDGERILVASEEAIHRMREVVEGLRAKGWVELL